MASTQTGTQALARILRSPVRGRERLGTRLALRRNAPISQGSASYPGASRTFRRFAQGIMGRAKIGRKKVKPSLVPLRTDCRKFSPPHDSLRGSWVQGSSRIGRQNEGKKKRLGPSLDFGARAQCSGTKMDVVHTRQCSELKVFVTIQKSVTNLYM